jgi:hypothetical protein
MELPVIVRYNTRSFLTVASYNITVPNSQYLYDLTFLYINLCSVLLVVEASFEGFHCCNAETIPYRGDGKMCTYKNIQIFIL